MCSVKTGRALFLVFLVFAMQASYSREAEKCYNGGKVDPSQRYNKNKVGTACHRQVEKVLNLEFDPRFDCTKAIREAWLKEYEVAKNMKCTY